jgi:hypothetical protein
MNYEQVERKEGFAPHQLLNTKRKPEDIRKEISTIMSEYM